MIISRTPPFEGPGLGSTRYNDWLRLVITHEYTHVLQLDMVAGLPRALQLLFGRLYFPNVFQPQWLIEGLATYEETAQTAGGRGSSPGAEMILRMAALEGPFPTLDQAGAFPDTWPGGQIPYLFGEAFMRHLAEKYGRETLAALSVKYSGRSLPFLVGSTGRLVLKRPYRDLWEEWAQSVRGRYEKERAALRAEGLTASTPLTEDGYLNLYPAYSRDSTRIAYVVTNARKFPGLYLMGADGSGKRRLTKHYFSLASSGTSVSWSPDGTRLYYTALERHRNSLFNDLYYYDLERGERRRLTRGLRARDPHPSPDGSRLVFVTNGGGRNRLAVSELPRGGGGSLREKNIRYLTAESRDLYGNPRWSPDSSVIAVSVRQPDGYQEIRILDPRGKVIAKIGHDRFLDGAPAWSPDGNYLYFSSDRSGIFNLFAYQIDTGALFQVTNVVGGAFTPSASPDGKRLAFSSYSARGFDIHVKELEPGSWKPATSFREPDSAPRPPEGPPATRASPYRPWSTLLPRFWFPWFGYNSESGLSGGFVTYGQDAVQRHRYLLTGLYGPSSNRVSFTLDYIYRGWRPAVLFRASDIDLTHSGLLRDPVAHRDFVERERTLGLSVTAPREKLRSQHYFTLGYRWRDLSPLTDLPPWRDYRGPTPAAGVLTSALFGYRYHNARRYPFSISPEGGRSVELGYERSDRALGGDFTLNRYLADWREYCSLPWKHHVLQARVFGGVSTGEVIPQGNFRLGGDRPGDISLARDRQPVYLRGYPENAFRGRKAGLLSLEYRFPIRSLERGWDTTPFFFRRLHGAVFAEAGNAWDGTFRSSELKRSAGTEARLDMTLGYFLQVTLRLALAYGFDEKGGQMVYLGLWRPLQ
jgi:hypothetical protein